MHGQSSPSAFWNLRVVDFLHITYCRRLIENAYKPNSHASIWRYALCDEGYPSIRAWHVFIEYFKSLVAFPLCFVLFCLVLHFLPCFMPTHRSFMTFLWFDATFTSSSAPDFSNFQHILTTWNADAKALSWFFRYPACDCHSQKTDWRCSWHVSHLQIPKKLVVTWRDHAHMHRAL